MSSFAVRIERVVSVEPHPNADRLDLIQVRDWRCVAQKGDYKSGDPCVYFPVDSILPKSVESVIFGPDSKVKLTKSRVKTIKLRGAISQGLAVKPDVLLSVIPEWERRRLDVGSDITKILCVTKYEPPASEMPTAMRGSQTSKKQSNRNFHKYTDLENAKNYPDVFNPGERVVVTEKIHGTNFRAGYVKTEVNTLWKRVLRFIGRLPSYEFAYGSRNVQMQDHRSNRKTWIQSHTDVSVNVYEQAVNEYQLRSLLKAGEVVYGEIYGDGIQKNYTYGCDRGQRGLVLFDIMDDGKYLSPSDFITAAEEMGLPTAPVLYVGPYDASLIKSLTVGDSVLAPQQKIREGVVVKPVAESKHPMLGRKVLKFVSDDYLLRDNTDFH